MELVFKWKEKWKAQILFGVLWYRGPWGSSWTQIIVRSGVKLPVQRQARRQKIHNSKESCEPEMMMRDISSSAHKDQISLEAIAQHGKCQCDDNHIASTSEWERLSWTWWQSNKTYCFGPMRLRWNWTEWWSSVKPVRYHRTTVRSYIETKGKKLFKKQ